MKPTQEQVIAWARKYGDWNGQTVEMNDVGLEAAYAAAYEAGVAAEREACAKVLDEMAAKDKLSNYYKVAALAIRERGAP